MTEKGEKGKGVNLKWPSKLRTYDRGRPAGGTTAVGARGSAPGPRASRGTLAIKTGGTGRAFWGHVTELQMNSRHLWGIPAGHAWLVAYPRFF